MHRLNVLHMTSMKRVQSIPYSITDLRNLKVLIINNCDYLKSISSLVGLEKLRRLKDIPNDKNRLVNLKVLDLSKNRSLSGSFPRGFLEKLSHLQTLNLRSTRIEVEPKELIRLKKLEILMVHFYELHKHFLYVKSGDWRRLVDYQIYYGAYDERNLRKAISLEAIMDVQKWKGVSGNIIPDNIQNLRLVDWESPMFYFLKKPTFADLQTISIIKYKSRYLFTFYLAQQLLRNVQELHIYDCDELKEIIGIEEEWVNQSNNLNYPTIVLPQLKILELYDLLELRSIYRGRMVCPSLKLIRFDESDKLERLQFSLEEEGNKQSPIIKLRGWNLPVSESWWDSFQWEDPNAKSMYNPKFFIESESIC